MQEKNSNIGSRMDKFKEEFRKRGYYFTNKQVLTQAFLAYTPHHMGERFFYWLHRIGWFCLSYRIYKKVLQ